MEKLVEDVKVGERVLYQKKNLLITCNYAVNGEGIGFTAVDEKQKEYKFSKSCGTYLDVIS